MSIFNPKGWAIRPIRSRAPRGLQPEATGALRLGDDHQQQDEGDPLDEVAVATDLQKQVGAPGIADGRFVGRTGRGDPIQSANQMTTSGSA